MASFVMQAFAISHGVLVPTCRFLSAYLNGRKQKTSNGQDGKLSPKFEPTEKVTPSDTWQRLDWPGLLMTKAGMRVIDISHF
jgi:hypothetical protein